MLPSVDQPRESPFSSTPETVLQRKGVRKKLLSDHLIANLIFSK